MATRMIVAAGCSVQEGVTQFHVSSATGKVVFHLTLPGTSEFQFVALPKVLSGDTARIEAAKYCRTLPEFKKHFKFLDAYIADRVPAQKVPGRRGRPPLAVKAEAAPAPVAAPKAAKAAKAAKAPKVPKVPEAAKVTPADKEAAKSKTLDMIRSIAEKRAEKNAALFAGWEETPKPATEATGS